MRETTLSIQNNSARSLSGNYEKSTLISNEGIISQAPKPYLYISIFTVWAGSLLWFGPRLFGLLDLAYSFPSFITMMLFILFIGFAWLYGFYNVGIMLFVFIYKFFNKKPERELIKLNLSQQPPVAILYTTCNDFVEESVISCVNQQYSRFTVYILDDSSDPKIMEQIDAFQARFPEKTKVIRREGREGFKAGNMNNALRNYVSEPYFAIADADEILPTDFLAKLINVIEADEKCGFVQANHRANIKEDSALSKSLGVGVDIHWKYYQPFRNDYGFVMFLGHGALIRTQCWQEIGGFPHIVSEDLGFAIHAREHGYRGRFVEDVICLEDFPEDMRAFRIRHMKWTRGTCEFLATKFKWLVKAKNISWTEKLDVLFPTLNLPLTLVYFLFMLVANLLLPFYYGVPQDVTLELAGAEFTLPIYALSPGFESIYTLDFFTITIMTFFAPVLCFIVGLLNKPLKLVKFISHSTAVYAALGPLSSLGVITFLISGKAIFLVTGDKESANKLKKYDSKTGSLGGMRNSWNRFMDRSHPDHLLVQVFEISIGLIFAIACIKMFQISFLGLCLAFMLMPLLHRIGWESKVTRGLAHVPFIFIMIGVALATVSLIGLQTIFFGYGFHF